MSELIGHKLGKYVLESKLGEGGMAAVFRSQHPQFDRPVAIKILPPAPAQDPRFRARFEREGRMIASLNHPHIIRIYDIDEADGLFYMVMDLLPGGTLEGRLREGGLDRKWSADVIVKMAEALEFAHTRGIIHRDIKPSNILLDADSQPVLADFGIARLAQNEGDPQLTSAGMIMGTPAYMAPEQLTGGEPDARSDIYSLGVVLYQLLAGRAPFTGDTMAVISGHLTKQPPSPREYVPDLPAALEAVVLQALSKQPEHRFKSAGVFAQALRSAAVDLEPGLVRVVSAAREVPAPTFSGVALPPATGATQALAASSPATVGQQVARYLPAGLAVVGLLLVGSLLLKYWALVLFLLLLLAGGGALFGYLRASAQGRKAAVETTRAISTATIQAAVPASHQEAPVPAERSTARLEAGPAQVLDEDDDVPEIPLPEPEANTAPTEAIHAQANADSLPTEVVPVGTPAAELAPTEALPAAQAGEQPTEAMPVPPANQQPTEALPAAQASEQPTEAIPAAADLPTEAIPTVTRPHGDDRTQERHV